MGRFSGRYWRSHLPRESNHGGSIRGERSLYTIYGYIAGARTKRFVILVPRHVVVDMSSILHTDYLEIRDHASNGR